MGLQVGMDASESGHFKDLLRSLKMAEGSNCRTAALPCDFVQDRFQQIQAFVIWEDAGFHLIHDVGERHSRHRVGEGVTAAGPGMAEGLGIGAKVLAELAAAGSQWIHHKTGGKPGRELQNVIQAVAERGQTLPPYCFWNNFVVFESTMVGQHSIKFPQGVGAAYSPKGRQGSLPRGWLVHFCYGMEAGGGLEGAPGQAGRIRHGLEESGFVRMGRFRPAGVEPGDVRIAGFRDPADPEIETQRAGEALLPNLPQGRATTETADAFIQKETKGARVITVSGAGRPCRDLMLQSRNHCRMVIDRRSPVQGWQPCLVAEQFPKSQGERETRPDGTHRGIQRHV